jgi:DNA polymerase III delta subunit
VDYGAFLRNVSQGQVPPVALVHGADNQLLDDALAAATGALFSDPSELALGREVLDGTEIDADTVVRSAQTLPFMTAVRLVAVRRAHALSAKGEAALAAYAADPSPTTRLLLLADEPLGAGRERRTNHWLLAAIAAPAVVALPARQGRQLEEWLRQRAARDGITLSEEAAHTLVGWVGDDSARLLGEVRKAALAGSAGGRSVGVREVSAVVGEQRLSDVFELTRAVERRETGQALRLLDRLLLIEEPMRLLGLLTRGVRTSWTVRDLHTRGQSVDQIARALRLPVPVVEKVVASAVAQSDTALAAKLRRCWEVERRLKSSGVASAEMAALVTELCNA